MSASCCLAPAQPGPARILRARASAAVFKREGGECYSPSSPHRAALGGLEPSLIGYITFSALESLHKGQELHHSES